jgi:hypothetical protein
MTKNLRAIIGAGVYAIGLIGLGYGLAENYTEVRNNYGNYALIGVASLPLMALGAYISEPNPGRERKKIRKKNKN